MLRLLRRKPRQRRAVPAPGIPGSRLARPACSARSSSSATASPTSATPRRHRRRRCRPRAPTSTGVQQTPVYAETSRVRRRGAAARPSPSPVAPTTPSGGASVSSMAPPAASLAGPSCRPRRRLPAGQQPHGERPVRLLGGANDFFNNPCREPADVAATLAGTVEAVIGAGGGRSWSATAAVGNTPLFAWTRVGAYATLVDDGLNAACTPDLAALRGPPRVTLLELDSRRQPAALAADNPFASPAAAAHRPWTRHRLLTSITTDDPDGTSTPTPSTRARRHQIVGVRAAAECFGLGAGTITVANTKRRAGPLDGGIPCVRPALANEMAAGRRSVRLGGRLARDRAGRQIAVDHRRRLRRRPASGALTIDAGGKSGSSTVSAGASARVGPDADGGRAFRGGRSATRRSDPGARHPRVQPGGRGERRPGVRCTHSGRCALPARSCPTGPRDASAAAGQSPTSAAT